MSEKRTVKIVGYAFRKDGSTHIEPCSWGVAGVMRTVLNSGGEYWARERYRMSWSDETQKYCIEDTHTCKTIERSTVEEIHRAAHLFANIDEWC